MGTGPRHQEILMNAQCAEGGRMGNYAGLVVFLLHYKGWSDAFEYVKKLTQFESSATIRFYNKIIGRVALSNEPQIAFKVLDKVKGIGVQPGNPHPTHQLQQ